MSVKTSALLLVFLLPSQEYQDLLAVTVLGCKNKASDDGGNGPCWPPNEPDNQLQQICVPGRQISEFTADFPDTLGPQRPVKQQTWLGEDCLMSRAPPL